MMKRVVALGFFDGVHIGHGELLKKTREVAERRGAVASVMTYSRHPSEIVGEKPVKLINTTRERCALISELYGIEDIIVKDFTREYSALSCEDFFGKIISEELSACHVVAGFDFRFGYRGAGDAGKLRQLCRENGIGCDIIPEVTIGGSAVSSSRIRECIAEGDMEKASRLLGHHHCIIGNVQHGANLGEKIGFPTVNQELAENVQSPKFGVYLSNVEVCGKSLRGVTNVGVRPTVSDGEVPRAETNILDFSGNIYGERVKVELLKFMREELRFTSVSELQAQIARDIESARLF